MGSGRRERIGERRARCGDIRFPHRPPRSTRPWPRAASIACSSGRVLPHSLPVFAARVRPVPWQKLGERRNDPIVRAFARSNTARRDVMYRRLGSAGEASPMAWGVKLTDRAGRRLVCRRLHKSWSVLTDQPLVVGNPCSNHEKLLYCYRAHHDPNPIRIFVSPAYRAPADSGSLAPGDPSCRGAQHGAKRR